MKRVMCLLLALMLLPAIAFGAVLKQGSSGEEVILLQQKLSELGLLTGKADGITPVLLGGDGCRRIGQAGQNCPQGVLAAAQLK